MATASRTDAAQEMAVRAMQAGRREKDLRLDQAGSWLAEGGGEMAGLLLAWFGRCGRKLPWRLNKDPYRVWLAEIMLQQTQVQTVIPFYEKYLQNWPTLADLARAPEEAVLRQWSGLGYYARARHLLAAARQVMDCCEGRFPAVFSELRALPGIGDYTAAAILSIAYGQPVAAVDGNIVRVFARLAACAWDPSDLAQRREVAGLSQKILPVSQPGDYNEALMDLGATICLPHRPLCPGCPLAVFCRAGKSGQADRFPLHMAGREVPVDQKILLALIWRGRVHVRQRPAKGLLASLYEFDWLAARRPENPVQPEASFLPETFIRQCFPDAAVHPLGKLVHRFSHRQWQLEGYAVTLPAAWNGKIPAGSVPNAASGEWVSLARLNDLPFATAMAGYRDQVRALIGNI